MDCSWTTSGIDYTELTKKQLTDWGIRYDKLLMGKPSYDLYIDDKSVNVDKHWKIPTKNLKSKKIESKIVKKGWGKEIWFVNNDEYCGKILCLRKEKSFQCISYRKKRNLVYSQG